LIEKTEERKGINKMEKTALIKALEQESEKELQDMYFKVVSEPNNFLQKKGFIRCPECSKEILMIPSLKAMNTAIENHVKIHKALLKTTSPFMNTKPMAIRLDLAQQVLLQASNLGNRFDDLSNIAP